LKKNHLNPLGDGFQESHLHGRQILGATFEQCRILVNQFLQAIRNVLVSHFFAGK